MDVGWVTSFEPSCVVPDDPGEVVRGARPLTAEDAERLREQMIARLVRTATAPAGAAAWPSDVEVRVRWAMRGWRAGGHRLSSQYDERGR